MRQPFQQPDYADDQTKRVPYAPPQAGVKVPVGGGQPMIPGGPPMARPPGGLPPGMPEPGMMPGPSGPGEGMMPMPPTPRMPFATPGLAPPQQAPPDITALLEEMQRRQGQPVGPGGGLSRLLQR